MLEILSSFTISCHVGAYLISFMVIIDEHFERFVEQTVTISNSPYLERRVKNLYIIKDVFVVHRGVR